MEPCQFEQDVDFDDDKMSQLMMRVAMQQLCFKANNGDLAAYKRLVLLQDRYKKLYEQPQYCEVCGSRLDVAAKEQSACECTQGS